MLAVGCINIKISFPKKWCCNFLLFTFLIKKLTFKKSTSIMHYVQGLTCWLFDCTLSLELYWGWLRCIHDISCCPLDFLRCRILPPIRSGLLIAFSNWTGCKENDLRLIELLSEPQYCKSICHTHRQEVALWWSLSGGVSDSYPWWRNGLDII